MTNRRSSTTVDRDRRIRRGATGRRPPRPRRARGQRVRRLLQRFVARIPLPRLRLPSWVPASTWRRRNVGMQVALLVGLLVLSARLVQVQAVDADELRERSAAQSRREGELPAQRGRIYDRAGAVLATVVDRATIFVDPSVYTAFHEDGGIARDEGEVSRLTAATRLAAALDDVGSDQVMQALTGEPESQYAVVAREVDWSVSQQVLALGLPGVHRLAAPTRTYPVGEMTGPVLGFTNHEGTGVSGLEARYDEQLSGTPGHLLSEVDGATGMDIPTSQRVLEPPVPGRDLVLTLDREIQAAAQQVADDTIREQGADGVSIVVLDAETAEVLAAASTPSFDPNDVRAGDDWRARPFTDAVEPGSVQKIVTVAAAWEEGLVDADTVVDVPNTWTVGGKTWDSHGLGARSMKVGEIVERSSNIGTMMVGDMLGPERLHDWLQTFGYGEPTGVGFPGESAGLVLPADRWTATSLPTISIGHGVAMSTAQLASAYQVLANDGIRVQPSLLRGTLDADGKLVPAKRPDTREVVSADTARAMRRMLRRVVDGDHGTGSRAAVDGYAVGGKTGTADKPLEDGRGYSDQTTAVFAGMAPIDDPELVVAVMVDEPANRYGGVAAAPAFSRVMARALVARNVVPDDDTQSIDEAITAANEAASRASARQAAAQRDAAAERAGRGHETSTAADAGERGRGGGGDRRDAGAAGDAD